MRFLAKVYCSMAMVFVAGMAQADGFARITTEGAFREQVVGKRITCGENDFYTIKRNGRLTGRFEGEALKGAWEWRDDVMCRTLTTVRPGTDCQVIEVRGQEVRGTRARGQGRQFTCRFK